MTIVTNVYGNPRTIRRGTLVSHVGGGWRCRSGHAAHSATKAPTTPNGSCGPRPGAARAAGTIGNYTNGLAFDSSCTFSSAFGGCLNLLSVQGAVVTGNARIVNTSSGGTVAQSMYHVGTNTGSGASLFTSQGVSFIGCGRDLPAVDGVHHFDIDLTPPPTIGDDRQLREPVADHRHAADAVLQPERRDARHDLELPDRAG